MHDLLNAQEIPDVSESFKESTPTQTVRNLKRLMGGCRRRNTANESPTVSELFDEDGFYISTKLSPEDEAWYCD